MNLRKLKLKDAKRMLEWMHDCDIVKYMEANFASKTIGDCKKFIEAIDDNNLNMAIVNDDDVYMGTASLKHIDKDNRTAEFAIIMHPDALGKGYAKYGMHEILCLGVEHIGLKEIYWCVSKDNIRAIKFYDKNLYSRTDNVPNHLKKYYTKEKLENYVWYVLKQ